MPFKKFLEKLQIEQIDQATPNSIKKFILSLHSKSYNRSTISRKTTVLRQFYKFLYSEKIILTSPFLFVFLKRKNFELIKFHDPLKNALAHGLYPRVSLAKKTKVAKLGEQLKSIDKH